MSDFDRKDTVRDSKDTSLHFEENLEPAEIEGRDRFIEMLRKGGRSESVPSHRLELMLKEVVQPKRPRWIFPTAFAAAATIAALLLLNRPDKPTSEGSIFSTSDPVVAARWLQPNFSFHVPALTLGNSIPLEQVHHSREACCFDFAYRGATYHVNVMKRRESLGTGNKIHLDSGFDAVEGRGVAWDQGDWTLVVFGPDRQAMRDVATMASRSLGGA